ncbi:Thioredoxin [Operophtera brumata]|uniref:Thioredoxin n=1 Tax=Operophtera brumata TaxID=104452 RepID=A0A0L7LR01_OPEBR|nr:Thioredoxin [Operophtera brumata]
MAIRIKDYDDLKTRLTETGDRLALIYFMTTWCVPCQVFGPKLDELAIEMQDAIVIFKVDCDECSDIAPEYTTHRHPDGLMGIAVPTIIFIKNDMIIEEFVFVKTCNMMQEFCGVNVEKLKNTIHNIRLNLYFNNININGS